MSLGLQCSAALKLLRPVLGCNLVGSDSAICCPGEGFRHSTLRYVALLEVPIWEAWLLTRLRHKCLTQSDGAGPVIPSGSGRRQDDFSVLGITRPRYQDDETSVL